MSLYQNERPTTFEEVLGCSAAITALQDHIARPVNERSHVFGIGGPSGTGKTTLARIFASIVGGSSLNIKEFNTADNRGIDAIRELKDGLQFIPFDGGSTCYIFDEAHGLTKDAKRALLKITEDVPDHVYFFFCTTNLTELFKGDEGKALKTRCTVLLTENATTKDLFRLVAKTAKKLGKDIDREVMDRIVSQSEGSPRQALQFLENIQNITDKAAALKLIDTGCTESPDAFQLYLSLLKGHWPTVSENLMKLKESNEDPEGLRRFMLATFSGRVLKQGDARAATVLRILCDRNTYTSGFPGLVDICWAACHLSREQD